MPVIAFPTNKHVIFGTCVLQQFLSTLDYPRNRLILSPRNSAELREEHIGMLPHPRVEIQFYMWGNHYMFARGCIADDDQLNFFMDSGLVALRKINDEPMVQAGFTSSRERYRKWGFGENEMEQGFFQSHLPIGVRKLERGHFRLINGRPYHSID